MGNNYDSGIDARVEIWAVALLQALKDEHYTNRELFKTVDVWEGQIDASPQNSSFESYKRFAPFAFVQCLPEQPRDGGDTDIIEVLQLSVVIGQWSETPGVARHGTSTVPGISRLRERVFDAINRQHPGAGFDCDNFYYKGPDYGIAYNGTRHATIQLNFHANNILA